MVADTYLTPAALAALMAESHRMRERTVQRRNALQRWEESLTEAQRHERAMFQTRMRNGQIERVTASKLGDL